MGKKLKEIKAQILALDLINQSRYWALVLPRNRGGPRFLPATWVNVRLVGLRRFLVTAPIILTTSVWKGSLVTTRLSEISTITFNSSLFCKDRTASNDHHHVIVSLSNVFYVNQGENDKILKRSLQSQHLYISVGAVIFFSPMKSINQPRYKTVSPFYETKTPKLNWWLTSWCKCRTRFLHSVVVAGYFPLYYNHWNDLLYEIMLHFTTYFTFHIVTS